ncbi:MAG: hypothetical protein ACOVS5_04805 [Oligoflexus sp.]|jgi:hypothetical protein
MKKLWVVHLTWVIAVTTVSACSDPSNDGSKKEATIQDDRSATVIDGSSIGLNEYGSVDTEESTAKEQGIHSRLSDDARVTFEQLLASLKAIRTERETICSHDKALQEKIGGEIKAIHSDSSLSDAEKRSRIQALFADSKAAIQADQLKFAQCIAEHRESIVALDQKGMALSEACGLVTRPSLRPEAPAKKPKQQGGQPQEQPPTPPSRPEPMSLEKLEAGLTSEACQVLLAP